MQSKVKLSKRQIKEDKFTTFMLQSKRQMMDNWQFIVIGIVVVALVIVGIVYFVNSRSQWQVEGSREFAQAMMEYRGGDRQVAITTLEQLLEDYGSHRVADEATFLLGKAHYESRNYNEAIRYWEQYLAKFKEDSLNRAAAQAGIAASYESQGDNAQAAEHFLMAIEENPEGPLVPEYRTGAMRTYLALGQIEQAREQLKLLEENYGNTDAYRRAALLFAEQAYPGQTTP